MSAFDLRTMPVTPADAADPAALARRLGAGAPGRAPEDVAKDFEAVLLEKLLDEVRRTIPKGGLLDEDGTTEQVDALFWSQLGREIGRAGGLGLWKQLYAQMARLGAADDHAAGNDAEAGAPAAAPAGEVRR